LAFRHCSSTTDNVLVENHFHVGGLSAQPLSEYL
ncbi:MAG: hypothetical protein ACI9UU_000454, partial [Candidatus Azotimanducaceae bacterium]